MAYAENTLAVAKEQPPNFASSVSFANERVGVLVGQLSELVDRLCGSTPQDASGGPVPVPNGLFNSVMDDAQTIIRRAETGIELIHRIERSLP